MDYFPKREDFNSFRNALYLSKQSLTFIIETNKKHLLKTTIGQFKVITTKDLLDKQSFKRTE